MSFHLGPQKARGGPRTKEEHPEEVGATPAEGPLLQRLGVLDQEEHVEHKVKACEHHSTTLSGQPQCIVQK